MATNPILDAMTPQQRSQAVQNIRTQMNPPVIQQPQMAAYGATPANLKPLSAPPAAALPSAPMMPPETGTSVQPIQAPKGTVSGDTSELGRLVNSKAGVDQIHNPFLHGAAKAGDVFLSALAPRLASVIPGTTAHHDTLIHQQEGRLAEEIGNQQKEAQTEEAHARIPLEAAQTENLEHPNQEIVPTAGGEQTFNPKSGSLAPITQNGQPVMPYVKPGNREHVVIQGPDGQPQFAAFDPQTNTYYDAADRPIQNPQPYEKPGNIRAVTIQLPGGQKAAGKADAQGNLLLENGQPAPQGTVLYQQPNYGQMVLPTKTITAMINGVPTIMQWDEKTQAYDKPAGVSAAGAPGHAMFQAGTIVRDGEQLINDITANKGQLGTLATWIEKNGLNTPIADPTLAGLQAELESFAALQPAMHGFRGTDALDTFNKIIGGLQKNPDATIASIRGILKTAETVNPQMQQPKMIRAKDPQGNLHEAPEGTPLPKGWTLQ